jgi:hypothetical protein
MRNHDERFEGFVALKNQVEFFWVVKSFTYVVRYHFSEDIAASILKVDRGSKILQHIDILPHHYMASQPRGPLLETHHVTVIARMSS